jgi:hypothetical protein
MVSVRSSRMIHTYTLIAFRLSVTSPLHPTNLARDNSHGSPLAAAAAVVAVGRPPEQGRRRRRRRRRRRWPQPRPPQLAATAMAAAATAGLPPLHLSPATTAAAGAPLLLAKAAAAAGHPRPSHPTQRRSCCRVNVCIWWLRSGGLGSERQSEERTSAGGSLNFSIHNTSSWTSGVRPIDSEKRATSKRSASAARFGARFGADDKIVSFHPASLSMARTHLRGFRSGGRFLPEQVRLSTFGSTASGSSIDRSRVRSAESSRVSTDGDAR